MHENNNLRVFFDTDFPLNKEGLEEMLDAFETIRFAKNSLLLENGKTENKLRFLDKGVVREYYTSNGKEANINFYTKPQFITDFSSFNNGTASKKNQECLTDVEIKILNKDIFLESLHKYQCGQYFIDLTFQRLLQQKESFEYNRITKSPDELYTEILSQKPNWLQQIPQYHIASYMGVTAETLSRIRKRIS